MAVASVTIYPVAGRRALMPEKNFAPVPPEGALVPMTPYYVTMIRHGDVTTDDAGAEARAAAAVQREHAAALDPAPDAVEPAPTPKLPRPVPAVTPSAS